MDQTNTETTFLLDLLKYTPPKETARLHEKLLKAHSQAQWVSTALKSVLHLALLSAFCFCLTAFSLPNLPEILRERLSQFFFLVASSATVCAVVFTFVWYGCRKDLNLKRENCRLALKKHLQPQLEIALQTREPIRQFILAEAQEPAAKNQTISRIPFREAASETAILVSA
jgi:hypothetical protein